MIILKVAVYHSVLHPNYPLDVRLKSRYFNSLGCHWSNSVFGLTIACDMLC